MTVEEMKRKKLEKGYSYAQIASLSGIPLGTVQKVFSGETEHPRYSTLQALEQVLKDQEESRVCDSAVYSYQNIPQKMQREYTIEDYFAIPDRIHVELIDSVLYEKESPTFAHQKIAGEIYRQIANYIIDNNDKYEAAIAPVDVQLDGDEKTIVQPDILILCDAEKIIKGRVFGAPDFVVEVISPETKRKDYFKKLEKYENAGVREYWILDPFKKQLLVFFFEKDIYAQIHDLMNPVPIQIYEGKLQIDFDNILKWCSEFV